VSNRQLYPSVLNVVLVLIAILIGIYVAIGIFEGRSLKRASLMELGMTYDRWKEAGYPTGVVLAAFLEGRDPNIVASNITLRVDATTYVTQFAMNRIKTSEPGTLFVTTNRQFLFWRPPKTPELWSRENFLP